MRICVPWHPARGVDLEVIRWELKSASQHVVVRLADGTGLRVPFRWTDAGGAVESADRHVRFTIGSLLELTALVEALDRCGVESSGRSSHSEEECDEATTAVVR